VPSASLPRGTVTFLFTDIEGSTQLWAHDPEQMDAAVSRHEVLLRDAITAAGGVVFKTVGDAVYAAFASALDAVTAAVASQRALSMEAWSLSSPLRVRMALHSGVVEARGGDYYGLPLSRVARLLAAGHGGQILLSLATEQLVREQLPPDIALRELGSHRLKDLSLPEQIFQLVCADLDADFPPLQSLSARRTNLPAQPTALIGREREIAEVSTLARRADVYLVTLTGPGGTGKTRLALQVAAELLDEFTDGTYFVDLAPIRDPELVATAIAQTLGVKESGGRPLLEELQAYLREKRLLLLLDNFEQVLDAAPLIAALRAAAPGLKVLVTSRTVLHLSGEYEYAVPPLALPEHGHLPPLERLTQYAAVQLFIARAQAAQAGFAVTNASAPAVAEICYRLDGLPLAIELAAARIKLFPAATLLKRLESSLSVLTGGPRDAPTRQQTLRNAIDWSYNLLDMGEQMLFARLSVFVGGCTIEAAEGVLRTEGRGQSEEALASVLSPQSSVLDGLAALMDQSLVRQVEVNGEPRFTMLETLREYAQERLEGSGEAEAFHARHARYFMALVETAEPKLRGPTAARWLDRLAVERDNLRAALEWGRAAPGDSGAEVAARLAGSLWQYWELRGYSSENRELLEAILTRTPSSTTAQRRLRAKALHAAGHLADAYDDLAATSAYFEESLALFRELGDKPGMAMTLLGLGEVGPAFSPQEKAAAAAYCEESLALFRELGDKWGMASALCHLGLYAWTQGDFTRARARHEEALGLFHELGDTAGVAAALCHLGLGARFMGDYARAEAVLEQGIALGRQAEIRDVLTYGPVNLGHVALARGDYARAEALLEQTLALERETEGIAHAAWALCGLGTLACRHGAFDRAEALQQESLALRRERNDWWGISECLEGLAAAACGQGEQRRDQSEAVGCFTRAARLLGAAAALRTSGGFPRSLLDREDVERATATARAALGDTAFEAAWEAGQAMTLDQAIASR
jgi:predicted ATPase/class 3 adenylate cyclase